MRQRGFCSPPQLRRGKPRRSLGWGGAGQKNQSVDQHHPGAASLEASPYRVRALRRHPSSAEEGSFLLSRVSSLDGFLGHLVASIDADHALAILQLPSLRVRRTRWRIDNDRSHGCGHRRRLRFARLLNAEIPGSDRVRNFSDLIIQAVAEHEPNASPLLRQYELLRLILCDE